MELVGSAHPTLTVAAGFSLRLLFTDFCHYKGGFKTRPYLSL